jgi:hypothetical protein
MVRVASCFIKLNPNVTVSKHPASGRGPTSVEADGFVTETGGSDELFRFTIQRDIATTQPLLIVVAPLDVATSAIGRPGHLRGDTNRCGYVLDTIAQ